MKKQIQFVLKQRNIKPVIKDDLSIFWVGANYEQDYSGFLQSLLKFGNVEIFYNKKGEYGIEYSQKFYDQEIIKRNSDCLIEQIEKQKKTIHILLGQMWAHLISVEALKEIQKMGIITTNIAMDDKLPELWGYFRGARLGSIGLAPGIDLTLQSTSDYCSRYLAEGFQALYWPMGSDPEIFKPLPVQKVYDVCFVGSNYGIRAKIVNAIQKSGVKVETFGNGWPNGLIDSKKTAEVFAQSKIILGVGTIAYNDDILTLKLRDFDGPISGTFYLTHRNPDLEELYEEGKEIELYSSIDECVKKINYYLQHSEEREAIAKAGRNRALKDHTWEKRFEKLFEVIGLYK